MREKKFGAGIDSIGQKRYNLNNLNAYVSCVHKILNSEERRP